LNLENSFDDITNALGVIADAKYEQALIVSDTISSINNVQGFSDALLSDYRGISGSEGNDVLVALDKDSVLYGGDGGHDRLIGGDGDDILITKGEVADISNHSIGEQLSGGAGTDMFVMINPEEINNTLDAIYREVHITDFNRDEGDRVLLMGYEENAEVILSDVNSATNIQTATIQGQNADSLTIYFDLSFAREFDTNFALRMADFDKVDAS
jgi:Ca2+-binding RTX toxin-like protein